MKYPRHPKSPQYLVRRCLEKPFKKEMWVWGVHSYRILIMWPWMSWDKPFNEDLGTTWLILLIRDLLPTVKMATRNPARKPCDFGCIVHLVNTGVFNYQPQLVSLPDFWLPSTVSHWKPSLCPRKTERIQTVSELARELYRQIQHGV